MNCSCIEEYPKELKFENRWDGIMNDINYINVKDEIEGSDVLTTIIGGMLEKNTLHVLGLATGGTMIPVYEKWVASSLDFSNVTTFNLDEYVGVAKENRNSYAYFMHEHLFDHKTFKEVNLLDGMADDLEAECARYEQLLNDKQLDLQLLGVGENGHIAFNEPGTSFDSTTHLAQLTEDTVTVNSRFFEEGELVPNTALTMGIQSIMNAKKIVLLAFGERKRAAIAKLKKGEVDPNWPITKLLHHQDVTIITDLT